MNIASLLVEESDPDYRLDRHTFRHPDHGLVDLPIRLECLALDTTAYNHTTRSIARTCLVNQALTVINTRTATRNGDRHAID